MIADYLQEVLSEVGTKKKTRKRVTFLAKTKRGMRNYLLEVISTATYLREGKTTCHANRKSIKRVLQEVLKEVLHEVFNGLRLPTTYLQKVLHEVLNGRKWPTTYLQKVLREVLQDDLQGVFHGNS